MLVMVRSGVGWLLFVNWRGRMDVFMRDRCRYRTWLGYRSGAQLLVYYS